jgi:hypothetical protein
MKTFIPPISAARLMFYCRMFLLVFALSVTGLYSQQITASYGTTAPEASLFFLNPRYLNPAFGSGPLGMFSNPAGLFSVYGQQFSLACATSYTSSAQFDFDLVDESRIYQPITLNTKMDVAESGGLSGIGYARQFGKWRVGLAMLQARRGGVKFQAIGEANVATTFDFDKAITKELFQNLPVDELPITWAVDTQAKLSFSTAPAELYVSILPVMSGFSYSSRHFSIGGGLTYYRLSSSHQTGQMTTEFSSHSKITGTPYGNDPISGLPWLGSISAELDLQDSPVTATYNFDVSGHRFALTLGGMMNYKLVSIGASYSNGLKATIRGKYNITTVTTIGYPQDNLFSDIALDFSTSPQVTGNLKFTMHEFAKDTLSSSDSGEMQIGGYHSISFGVHFMIFGIFMGTEIPKSYPDLMTTHFGAYTDFPLPMLPVRLNFGYIQCIDAISSALNSTVPFRVVTHLGGGIAFQLPTHKWLHYGEFPAWVRVGLRSSLTSYALDIFENKAEKAYDQNLPSPLENLTLSLGLDVPF